MLYPAQTSFIPLTVALARFAQGHSVFGNYDYWYLGEVSFRYLTGPVVPGVLFVLKSVFGGFSYFEGAIAVVIVGQLIWVLGWGILTNYLAQSKKLGFITAVLVLIFPLHWVFSLGLFETSSVLATSFTPWVLYLFAISVRHNEKTFGHSLWLPSLAFAFLLLTNTVASIPAILGMIILAFVLYKKWEIGFKKLLFVLVIGWALTLWWYSPSYWFNLLFAPSIGGKTALGAFGSIFGFLRLLAPVLLAVGVVFFGFGKRDKIEKFTYIWLFAFGFMTLFRMLSDINFWMDWTAWIGEVEVGVALLAAGVLSQPLVFKKRSTNFIARGPVTSFLPTNAHSKYEKGSVDGNSEIFNRATLRVSGNPSRIATPRFFGVWSLIIGIYLIVGWVLAFSNRGFWLPRASIENTVEYKIAKWLEADARGPVFLSGSTAFWLNSLVDVRQVRGGRDEASVDRSWRDAAWEIREGTSAQRSYDALKGLGVNYLVVHGNNSREYYHDFKSPLKFEASPLFEKVYDANDDFIYKVR